MAGCVHALRSVRRVAGAVVSSRTGRCPAPPRRSGSRRALRAGCAPASRSARASGVAGPRLRHPEPRRADRVRSSSNNDWSASSGCAPRSSTPASLNRPSRARGSSQRSAAMSQRRRRRLCAATAVSAAERSRGTTTALTPAASPLRRQAPRLRGSVTPSSSNSKVVGPTDSSTSSRVTAALGFAASATTPWCGASPASPRRRYRRSARS